MSYSFADRLIEMRKSKGLSQEELAKRLGVSRQAISKWERAESTPDIANLMALADLYETSLDNLVRGTEEGTMKEVPAEETVTVVEEASETESAIDTVGIVDAVGTNAATEATPTTACANSNGSFPPPPDDAQPIRPPAPAYTTASAPTTSPTPAPAPTGQPATQLEKNPLLTFPYPLFVVLAYLVLGFCFNLWHPGWIIFFTIPFYYWIISVIKHDPEYIARHTVPRQ